MLTTIRSRFANLIGQLSVVLIGGGILRTAFSPIEPDDILSLAFVIISGIIYCAIYIIWGK